MWRAAEKVCYTDKRKDFRGKKMKNECETSFCIVGDFDPDVVTKRLGIDPDVTWKKEDVKKAREAQRKALT